MNVIFNSHDRRLIAEKLEHAGLHVSESRIDDVLYNVRAAFSQQFEDEADYLINEFEVS